MPRAMSPFWKSCLGLFTDRTKRARLVTLIVALAALGNLRLLRNVRDYFRADREPRYDVAAYDQRLQPLRKDLQSNLVLGYYSVPGMEPSRYAEKIICTRFALAPYRILENAHRQFVLLDSGEDPPPLPDNLELFGDWGQGIRIYRNREPR